MRFLSMTLAILVIGYVSTARMDIKKRGQSMYRMSDVSKQEGIKGGHTTGTPAPRKGEYYCGNRICKLRPGEVPKGCEGGECQYNVGHEHRN